MAGKIDENNLYHSAGLAGMLIAANDTIYILEKRDLDLFEDEKLAYLMRSLDKASDIINDHLTAKKKNLKRLN